MKTAGDTSIIGVKVVDDILLVGQWENLLTIFEQIKQITNTAQ